MGILADFFVADDEAASRYHGMGEGAIYSKGFTILELSTLWAILETKPWDVTQLDGFPVIADSEDSGQTVCRLPEALVSELAALNAESATHAAERWGRTDELARLDVATLRKVIDELVTLARRARERRQHLYIWNCT
jgi:hypothetical protein